MLFKNYKQIIKSSPIEELNILREDVLDILVYAINAVDPYNAVKSRLGGKQIIFENETIDISDFKNIFLVGFGKASVGMTNAICDSILIKKGVVVTNDPDSRVENDNILTIVGGHPIPNDNSIKGAEKILEITNQCKEEDLLIVLISGGGSALLCKPRVDLSDLQETTDLLLKSGADINEINTIRKHLSFVKGGQLVKSVKSTVISFIISDIVGDPLEFIASGPTYPDSTIFSMAEKILRKYDLSEKVPSSIIDVLEDGINGKIPETPKKNDQVFDDVYNFIVANNENACQYAKLRAEELGYDTMLLTTSLTGEARDIGKYLVDKARNYYTDVKKIVFIAGGETTVTVKGEGKGGRNQEMILGGLREIEDANMVFASFATDGIDGKSDAAGGIADGSTMSRAREANLNPEIFLKENNSYEFLKKLNDLLMTGPTGTNVMDIQIILKG